MGVHQNISSDKFPRQGDWLGKEVNVYFHYDLSNQFNGKIIRDDMTEPFVTIIQLDDDRVVLTTECQYSLK
ncbi:hypothetical protein [Paenibacillus dendritiformis]|uniref:hypothetical protein n=1 Tax=Paenibacillus dendritiformis TaxID=130049 RepID=UPI00387E0768